MKLRCGRCKKDLDVDKFYKDRTRERGYQSHCKECRKKDNHFNEQKKVWAKNNKDKVRIARQKWDKDNAVISREATKTWRYANPKKYFAHRMIKLAIEQGVIEKDPCYICDNPKSQGHHENYDEPLEVIWLCAAHHKERHVELKLEKK